MCVCARVYVHVCVCVCVCACVEGMLVTASSIGHDHLYGGIRGIWGIRIISGTTDSRLIRAIRSNRVIRVAIKSTCILTATIILTREEEWVVGEAGLVRVARAHVQSRCRILQVRDSFCTAWFLR